MSTEQMNRGDWLAQFGAAVKAAGVDSGWSQSQLADRLGVSRSNVANFEAGRQDMPSSTLVPPPPD
jgi:transcriptional regulator with XRE-family HTH domain